MAYVEEGDSKGPQAWLLGRIGGSTLVPAFGNVAGRTREGTMERMIYLHIVCILVSCHIISELASQPVYPRYKSINVSEPSF